MQKALGATERVHELLDENPEINCQAAPAAKAAARLLGDVHFEGVSFRYPSRRQTAVLRGLTLHANAGDKTAVGPQRSRKIDHRFAAADSANPTRERNDRLLAGVQYSLSELRGNMAFVPQEVLPLGSRSKHPRRPDASREEISPRRARRRYEFIERFRRYTPWLANVASNFPAVGIKGAASQSIGCEQVVGIGGDGHRRTEPPREMSR